MGIELELLVMLVFSVLGQSTFARFEIETPAWRKIFKWFAIVALTLGLYRFAGHWALLLPIGLGIAGTTFHFIWCRRNGIDPFRATPVRKYYELRGWNWPAACILGALALCSGNVIQPVVAQQKPPAKSAPRSSAKPTGTLAQVMRGIYFPNSNLIFDVQQNDPSAPRNKADRTGGSATDTYGNAYSGWEAVENAAVAITDGVDLILTPGRLCQNGKPVPLSQADFRKFAQDMRAAGLTVLEAARTRNQEKVSDATNNLADACSGCHEVYRDKGPADSAARCTPLTK